MKNLLKYCLILFIVFGISFPCFAGSLLEGFRVGCLKNNPLIL